MRNRAGLGGAILLLGILVVASPVALYAAKPTPVTITLYQAVVDEQNTSEFYDNTSCPGSNLPLAVSPGLGYNDLDVGLGGDGVQWGPTVAYDFGSPWTLASNLLSSAYDRTNCSANGTCVVSSLVENNATLNLNTRSTPRQIWINFSYPCPASVCGFEPQPLPTQLSAPFQVSQARVSVFLSDPFTGMPVCDSTACFQAQEADANLWFDDPVTPLLTWKVRWGRVRVLRLTSNQWYIIADSCDGTSTAALYRTENKRGKTSFQGYYLMPFFITVTK